MGNRDREALSPVSGIDLFLDRLRESIGRTVLIWQDEAYDGAWLLNAIEEHRRTVAEFGITPGGIVALIGDYTPSAIAMLLALLGEGAIVAPLLPGSLLRAPQLLDLADPAFRIDIGEDETANIAAVQQAAPPHPLVETLRHRSLPGLILFTSGSTGEPKGVVHDFSRLAAKFAQRRPAFRMMSFLTFDHAGGINTLLHAIATASPIVLLEKRSVDYVCGQIERHALELLPTSPTFLNMLLLGNAQAKYDLSSLRLITYGSEAMPPSTLENLAKAFPDAELRQTYGSIEIGVLRCRSRADDSLWITLGGKGVETRIVDGMLEIKTDTAMLGYLNAESPFTADGYYRTGDRVECDGDALRILGRDSDLINVGGQKVYPAEVLSVLLECEDVADAVVFGEPNPIMGMTVAAKVRLQDPSLDPQAARNRIKRFCGARLDPFKIPVRITVSEDILHGDRFKRRQ